MGPGTDATIKDLLAGLTEPQREAVTHTDGPVLILAGPGSGKTRVVTRRAAHLAYTVTEPSHVLAITFTNKAAREMQSRIEELQVGRGMWVGTFHAFCARLLRENCERVGLGRNFTILDRDDRRKIIKQAVEACDLSATNFQPAAVDRVISNAKNDMQTAASFEASASDWRSATIARIFHCYEGIRQEQNALDFDDLLLYAANMLKTDDEVREQLGDRYRYVLVDEYQDTNAAQYEIAQLLTRKHGNICVTGDPDQSIYGWRGANIQNILSFETDHPGAKVVHLEQNYRSTKRILAAAGALIAGNRERKLKSLWTDNESGSPVRIVELESGEEEAGWIAKDIARLTGEGVRRNEIAVFYRINSLSRALEEAFLREGIDYQIARGLEFYNRKEIKDVVAYLRVLVNPADELALLRIINTPPRGIGATSIERLKEAAASSGQRLHECITGGADLSQVGRSAAKVAEFGELLLSLKPVLDMPAPAALDRVMSQTGLRAMYGQADGVDGTAGDNLDELLSAAGVFQMEHPEANLVDWLEHAALSSDVDGLDDGLGAVTLMTLHAAKGLEFNHVYLIGLEEGLLPMRRRDDDDMDIEEERRLCFVGMTRARQRLTLSRAIYRVMRGAGQRTVQSQFLDELPAEAVQWDRIRQPGYPSKTSGGDSGGPKLPDNINQWAIGSIVRHPSAGLGRIEAFNRGGKLTYVTVLFEDGETRSWVLEYSDLELVDFAEID